MFGKAIFSNTFFFNSVTNTNKKYKDENLYFYWTAFLTILSTFRYSFFLSFHTYYGIFYKIFYRQSKNLWKKTYKMDISSTRILNGVWFGCALSNNYDDLRNEDVYNSKVKSLDELKEYEWKNAAFKFYGIRVTSLNVF
jgi:hypothetical protein